jgi:catechol 2,3-dioxygenase-like lactoylglutathione lyase family enzyme
VALSTLDVISIPVTDQQRARDFYVDTLGFTLVADTTEGMGPDQRWVQVAPPGGGTTITLVTWFPTMPPGCLKGLVITCDDADATFAELTAKGVPVGDQGGVQDAPWGRWFGVDDPDGNGWVIQESPR